MSDPRFRPRHMTTSANSGHFGKNLPIEWLVGTSDLERSRIEAARLQHRLALKINARLHASGHSIRSYAELAGIGYDRMAKVLRGEALMRLEDVSDAQRLLGGILPVIEHA